MSEAVLLHAAPERSADLFHAVPLGIGDPFTYLEADGRRVAVIGVLDRDAVEGNGIEVIDPSELGRDELSAQGADPLVADAEVALRAAKRLGLERATVPPDFPVLVADHLRAAGFALDVDADAFMRRRRVKTDAQLEGILRAQAAADAAMAVARELLTDLRDGLTSEDVRRAMQAVCAEHGADLPDDVIVSSGAQAAIGHESGSGPIAPGAPVIVDVWPHDKASRCWADMTRSFVAGGGEPPEELARYWSVARDSLDRVLGAIRPGVAGRDLFALSCEPFHEVGIATQLSKEPGTTLEDGYFHSLGHGVGLEIHERPYLGRASDELVAGDVIAVEPGCYRRGFGGCRLESLVLVTEDGGRVLTDFPYEL
ncbi:MAG: M24 family metallopeptidase [Actinomycetota bacterium]|nr:M24 family metallopeptidase [Actinomycetota bacterium]